MITIGACSSTKKVPTAVPRVSSKFDFTPPSQAPIGSAKMTIAIVKPIFVSKNPEYLVSPFPEMATSMGNDFEELLAAKGFTMRGPFASRDEMVYTEKVNSSFILEIQIDLNPVYNTELIKHSKTGIANILIASMPLANISYTTKGNITFGGNLTLTALSPQYGEKIWKKSIALEIMTFSYTGTEIWPSVPGMAEQLIYDNGVFNAVSTELEKFYSKSLEIVWKQIDPEEMKTVTDQAKKADKRTN